MRSFQDVRAALDRAQREQRRLEDDAAQLRTRLQTEPTEGLRERLENVQRAVEKRDLEVAELEAEAGQAMADGLRSGDLTTEDLSTGRDRQERSAPEGRLRSEALRANERAEFLPERAREHMERQLRTDGDPNSGLARYTVALSSRDYFRAFAKWFRDPVSGGHEWTPKEREAVKGVRELERSMTLGTGSAGGFLVPYELDPAIVITASYVDPMREICRVDTTTLNEKRYATSAGSTSSWNPEETEVSDDSPTLAQPSITAKKAQTFVPVSIELFEDSSIAQEVARLFADSKANHESLSFTLTQTNGPVGLISAVITAGAPRSSPGPPTRSPPPTSTPTRRPSRPGGGRARSGWRACRSSTATASYRRRPTSRSRWSTTRATAPGWRAGRSTRTRTWTAP